MTEGQFLKAFEDFTLEEFHRADHIRMAWLYLRGNGRNREPNYVRGAEDATWASFDMNGVDSWDKLIFALPATWLHSASKHPWQNSFHIIKNDPVSRRASQAERLQCDAFDI
jgi:hypothetical protein